MLSPKVSFVLINLNQEEHTRECIKSLQRLSYQNVEIVLVDNASLDDSGVRLHQQFPLIVYIQNEKNLGFAEGNNVGIRSALQRNADYIVLLNNDTIVERDFIQPLVDVASSDNTVGVQCCKIYLFSDLNKLWYAGGVLDVHKAHAWHRGLFEVDDGKYDKIEETGFASGCMMFMPRSVVERVGLLDSSFYIYFEDSDWCMRAQKMGYKILYNPNAKLWHKTHVTTGHDSPFYLYFTLRNKILFLHKHSRPSKWLIHLPYFIYFYLRQIVRMSLKWHSIIGTRAVIAGLFDGLRNFTGEYGEGRFPQLFGKKQAKKS